MKGSLYIAWKYISFNKIRTVTLIACATLILFVPESLELLLRESESQLTSRAESTPLIVGAKGSALDLVMNSLYFAGHTPELITMKASNDIAETQLAKPIPIYTRFRARGYSIVGTTLDYFDFRNLEMARGRNLAILGDCVVGAKVAERLSLEP
ncbi:MAG: ABC transporter permease, partial [Planctomycetota bacterium]